MIGFIQKAIRRGKDYAGIIKFAIALLLLWAGVFIFFYNISPKSATIYYSGSSEKSRFEIVEEQRLMFEVRSNTNTQQLMFGGPEEQTIYVVDYDLSQGRQLEEQDLGIYENKQIFQFINGSADFFCDDNPILLTIRMPDDAFFSYSFEIKNVGTAEGARNLITISDFPEMAVVTMRSDKEIEICGNRTENHLQLTEYQIINCNSVSFYVPDSQGDTENAKEPGNSDILSWRKSIDFFEITNSERQTLEFTMDAQAEFREIGHVTLSGNAESGESLEVDISDFGACPLPVTISGNVGKELKIAGQSPYLTATQWLRTNMTQILLALMGVIFSTIIVKPAVTRITADDSQG